MGLLWCMQRGDRDDVPWVQGDPPEAYQILLAAAYLAATAPNSIERKSGLIFDRPALVHAEGRPG